MFVQSYQRKIYMAYSLEAQLIYKSMIMGKDIYRSESSAITIFSQSFLIEHKYYYMVWEQLGPHIELGI